MDEGFLPVTRFRGAMGQIEASGAIPEAHLDLHTPRKTADWHQLLSRYNEVSTRLVSGNRVIGSIGTVMGSLP